MSFFRSNKVLHLRIRMPSDIDGIMRIMDILGKHETESLQFIDLTKEIPDSQKSFSKMLKRVEQMEIKTTQFMNYASEFNVKIYFYKNYEKFIDDIENDISKKNLSLSTYFDNLEIEIVESEKKIMELIESHQKMKEELIIELEKKLVFEKYFKMTGGMLNIFDLKKKPNFDSISYFMGVIRADNEIKMNRMILRMGRGRAISTFFDFEIPQHLISDSHNFSKNKFISEEKKIFIVIFPSEAREYLIKKMIQICDILSANHYIIPENKTKAEIMRNLEKKIIDKRQYLIESEISIKKYLKKFSGNEDQPSRMDLLRLYLKKEKQIYTNLNKCIIRDNFIDGEVWVLEDQKDTLTALLNSGVSKDETKSLGSFLEINENILMRPTYIPYNEFIYPFQEIVNIYGIPRYREINPALFNIVFFPFLFGIMFGDIGHGLVIFLFSLYLIYYNNKNFYAKNYSYIFKLLIKFRYFFLLLSICSIYSGLLYNEFFSIPLPLCNSCYEVDKKSKKFAKKINNCNYSFGMDTKWFMAENQLAFFNSFKMKFSVIIGVIHMMIGVCLKGINDLYFKNYYGIIFEFIPQFIFTSILLLYMVIMIYIKWNTNYIDTSKAPSIITLLINIIIKGGSVENLPLWGKGDNNNGYTQEKYHKFILFIIIILVPFMIFPKPFLDYKKYKKKKNKKLLKEIKINNDSEINNLNNVDINQDNDDNSSDSEEELYSSFDASKEYIIEKTFTDFLINQLIYSIEFILGIVSNTASYLRLWALSLAHSELSKVFFEKSLKNSISSGEYNFGFGFVIIFIGYFIFANITIFVLIGMDFMECFLHTLRLHWVEFQNKFYNADGYLFEPFSFKNIIEKYIE